MAEADREAVSCHECQGFGMNWPLPEAAVLGLDATMGHSGPTGPTGESAWKREPYGKVTETWRKALPDETSMGCIHCGDPTEILRVVEVTGCTAAATCYCSKCSPIVFFNATATYPWTGARE